MSYGAAAMTGRAILLVALGACGRGHGSVERSEPMRPTSAPECFADEDCAGGLCAEGRCVAAPHADDEAAAETPAIDVEPRQRPGPNNLRVDCHTDGDCSGGVCCTNAYQYESLCLDEDTCTGGNPDHRGLIDACLTDAQCQRRNGSRPVCCHDPADRNYCAPVRETCLPVEPCNQPGDCRDAAAGPCCSRHGFYQETHCLPVFFSAHEGECADPL
jgi:hypothetical protein